MKTKDEYLTLLRHFKERAAGQYGIRQIGIFGSVARGEQTEGSDVDIVYEGEPDILMRVHIKNELEELFGCPVDVVRLRHQLTTTLLNERILKDAIYV